jgi:hypothetical protein
MEGIHLIKFWGMIVEAVEGFRVGGLWVRPSNELSNG